MTNDQAAAPARYQAINFREKLQRIGEQWSPRVVAEMNDYQFKLAKLEGDFIWHSHPDTDEAFIVLEGSCGSTSAMERSPWRPANSMSCPRAWNTSPMPKPRSNCC